MTSPRYTIISTDPDERFSLDQAAELTGVHREMILEFVRADLVHVDLAPGPPLDPPEFDESALVRLRHIEHLRREHVNLRTVRYILGLLDQLEEARHELRTLRERLR